jgi:hypothetical protein
MTWAELRNLARRHTLGATLASRGTLGGVEGAVGHLLVHRV